MPRPTPLAPLLAPLVAAPLLAGCVIAIDPIRLATVGPDLQGELAASVGGLRPGDRLALLLTEPGPEAAALHRCIAAGLGARLPDHRPAAELPDDAAAGALGAVAEAAAAEDGMVPPGATALGYDWLVAVRDRSEVSAEQERTSGFGGTGAIGISRTRGQHFTLHLEAVVLDLRAARRLGSLAAHFETERRSGIMAGIFGGAGAAAPFIMPVIELPGGTSALAICDAFGRAVAEALVKATTPATPEPVPATPAPARPAS